MSQASVVTTNPHKKVDFLYFGAYDATTEYVVLEFDFKAFLLNVWREGTTRISTTSFGEISSVQSDNKTVLVRFGTTNPFVSSSPLLSPFKAPHDAAGPSC